MIWNVTEHMIFLLSLAVICSFSHWQETRNQSKRLGVYCSYYRAWKENVDNNKNQAGEQFPPSRDSKSQMASLLWSQHVCDGWQLTLLWQEPSWCQRGLSAQLPACAPGKCHHTPSLPTQGQLQHSGLQAELLLPGFPPRQQVPPAELSISSGSGTLAQGGIQQNNGSGTGFRVCTDTSWGALRVPWLFSSHLLPLGVSFNLHLYLTQLIAATLTLYFQCFKCT